MTAIAVSAPLGAEVSEIPSHCLPQPPAGVGVMAPRVPAQRRGPRPTGALAGVPCAARPSTGFRHLDGPCQCFFGGPPPTFPATPNPAASA